MTKVVFLFCANDVFLRNLRINNVINLHVACFFFTAVISDKSSLTLFFPLHVALHSLLKRKSNVFYTNLC